MQTRDLQREQMLAEIIIERDTMILTQHQEILELQQKVKQMENQTGAAETPAEK